MGGRVRGTLHADSSGYDFEHASDIAQHFMIPESQDAVVVLRQPSVADAICFAVSVLSTIDLYDQSRFSAHEVNNVTTDRLLANELATLNRSRTQSVPQAQFGVG